MYRINENEQGKIEVWVDGGLRAIFMENARLDEFCAKSYPSTRLFIGDPLTVGKDCQYEAVKGEGLVGVYSLI